MRPTAITLEGFQSYKDPQRIDLSAVQEAAITGRVGAGKSSILDGITFALYGVTRSKTMDGVINTASTKATCEVEFTHRDGQWKVKRTTTRSGNTKAYLYRWDDENIDWVVAGDADGRVGMTDEAIRDLLGLSWPAFRASLIVEQGKSSAFTDASPGERYRLLTEIVELGKYEKWLEAAREQRTSTRNEITQVRTRIDEQASLLADADQVAATHEATVAERTALIAQVDTATTALTAAEQAEHVARAQLDVAQQQAHVISAQQAADRTLAQANGHVDQARQVFMRTQEVAHTLPAVREAHVQALAARDQANDALTSIRQAGEEARSTLDRLGDAHARALEEQTVIQERIAGMDKGADSDACFTCGQHLPGDVHDRVITALREGLAANENLLADLTAQQATAQQAINQALRDHEQATLAARRAQAEADVTARKVQDAERAEAELDEAQNRLMAAMDAVDEAMEARKALNIEVTVDPAAAKTAWEQATATTARAREDLASLKDRIAQVEARVAVLADRIERHETARQAVKSLNDRLLTLQADEHGWTMLVEAYSPAGIPRMILDTAVADINADLDSELSALSGGALTASLDTIKTTRAGTMKAELNLIVTGQDGSRPYESFSGGQRFLVDLALHLALAKTLGRRSGAQLGFLAVDEGWGALEGEEREAVLRTLHNLAVDHEALLLAITHIDEVANAFPTRIEAELLAGTTVTTVH